MKHAEHIEQARMTTREALKHIRAAKRTCRDAGERCELDDVEECLRDALGHLEFKRGRPEQQIDSQPGTRA